MKKPTFYLSIAILCMAVACSAQKNTAGMGNVVQEIKNREQQLAQALQQADTTALNKIYAPQYIHTAGRPARNMYRADLIASYRNRTTGGSTVRSMAFNVDTVQAYGQTVVATGSFKRESYDKEGRNTGAEGLFTHMWVRGGNGWQLVAGHHSPTGLPNAQEISEKEIRAWIETATTLQREGNHTEMLALAARDYTRNWKNVNINGLITPKDSVLAAIQNMIATQTTAPPETLKREDLHFDWYGDAGVVTGKTITRMPEQAQAGIDPEENRFAYFFVRDSGRWKLATTFITPIRDTIKDKQEIMALEQKLRAAQVDNDTAAINNFFNQHVADEFYAVANGGTLKDKAAALAGYRTPGAARTRVEAIDVAEPRLLLLNDLALYTFKALKKEKLPGGKIRSKAHRVSNTYAKKNGQWKLVSQHLAEITPEGVAIR